MIVIYFLGALSVALICYTAWFYIRGMVRALRISDEVMELCLDYDERNFTGIESGQLESAFIWFAPKLPSKKHLAMLEKKPRLKDFYNQDELNRIKK